MKTTLLNTIAIIIITIQQINSYNYINNLLHCVWRPHWSILWGTLEGVWPSDNHLNYK